ncbi:MAG: hypothetical protein JSU82_06265 [Rhodospirillales bacterium]|nr:MAG: hypothetical protein JSU82_06265 [Rhodospirillales bacterium]
MSAVALMVVALIVAGCGFEPLYGGKQGGAPHGQLASVKVQTIPGRVGQQVHNYLLDRINSAGRPAVPLYLLAVDLDVQQVSLSIEQDETATRAKVVFLANFELQDIATGDVLLSRLARSTNTYNIVDSAVQTRSAEQDAIDRAARQVSDEISLILSLYFRRQAAQTSAR